MPRKVGWLEMGVEIELDELRQCLEVMESYLESRLGHFEKWVEEQASELAQEERREFYDFHSDEYWELCEAFPTILRSSLFVACYSLLEHELTSLCRYVHRRNACSNEPSFRTGIIFKARNYLSDEARIKFPDHSPSWQIITCYYNPMRNVIVHRGGKVDEKRLERLKPFIDSNPSVALDSLGRLRLHREFCPEVIDIVTQFFRGLFEATQDLNECD